MKSREIIVDQSTLIYRLKQFKDQTLESKNIVMFFSFALSLVTVQQDLILTDNCQQLPPIAILTVQPSVSAPVLESCSRDKEGYPE